MLGGMGVVARLWAGWRAWFREPTHRAPSAPDAREADDASESADDTIAVMEIGESIDLHHFSPRDIPSVVDEYLREARRKGFREVRVIHGKGKGVQRRRVHIVLSNHRAVAGFRSDGLGSTIVELEPRRSRDRTAR